MLNWNLHSSRHLHVKLHIYGTYCTINQPIKQCFIFVSVHIEVMLDKEKEKKKNNNNKQTKHTHTPLPQPPPPAKQNKTNKTKNPQTTTATTNIHRMWNTFVKISFLLNTYYLNVLLPQSYFRKNGYDFNACNVLHIHAARVYIMQQHYEWNSCLVLFLLSSILDWITDCSIWLNHHVV